MKLKYVLVKRTQLLIIN